VRGRHSVTNSSFPPSLPSSLNPCPASAFQITGPPPLEVNAHLPILSLPPSLPPSLPSSFLPFLPCERVSNHWSTTVGSQCPSPNTFPPSFPPSLPPPLLSSFLTLQARFKSLGPSVGNLYLPLTLPPSVPPALFPSLPCTPVSNRTATSVGSRCPSPNACIGLSTCCPGGGGRPMGREGGGIALELAQPPPLYESTPLPLSFSPSSPSSSRSLTF